MEVFYINETEDELLILCKKNGILDYDKIIDYYTTFNRHFIIMLNEEFLDKLTLKRGDIVILKCIENNRSDGVLIFDGKKIIYLDYEEEEDVLLIPSVFNLYSEFPITYWGVITGYNCIKIKEKNFINYHFDEIKTIDDIEVLVYKDYGFKIIIGSDEKIEDVIKRGLYMHNFEDNDILYSYTLELDF